MIYFKACPRCQGDMHPTSDLYGKYVECFQCGYESEVTEERARTLPDLEEIQGVKVEAA